MSLFQEFLNQLPPSAKQNVDILEGKQLTLFKPRQFLDNVETQTREYHLVLLSEAPPPLLINDKAVQISGGKLFTVNPGMTVRCIRGGPTKEYYSLAVRAEYMSDIAKQMGFLKNIQFLMAEHGCSNALKQAFYRLDRELRNYDCGWQLMQESLEIQLLALVLREVPSNVKVSVTLPDKASYVKMAIEYIHAFYDSNISIHDICREIHITPYHFIRVFKNQVGQTPHEYLLGVRIQKAKELLEKRECSISEVAQLCGFVSLSHFSSVFKSKTGFSPSQFCKTYFRVR